MPNAFIRVFAGLGCAITALVYSAMLTIAPVPAAPGSDIHDVCKPPATVDADMCTARLVSVTANSADGTIAGTPVGGGVPLTFSGQSDAYLKSVGFGDPPPDAIQQWDAAIDRVNNADPSSSPDWYGVGKAKAFLPRQLNDQATRFPANTIVVRFTNDDTHAGWFRLASIQPTAQ